MLRSDAPDRVRSRFQPALLLMALCSSLASVPAIPQDSCSRPLCQSGERYRAVTPATNVYGWCEVTGPGGSIAHQRRECPAEWTLQPASGTCVKRDCCPERPLCNADETYENPGPEPGYGRCNFSSGGYKSHRVANCPSGWTLDVARGVCQQYCPKVTGTVKGPAPPVVKQPEVDGTIKGPPPLTAKPPDLVVRNFALVRRGKCVPGEALLVFSVTVANVGTAPSPALTGREMVQVKEPRRGWGSTRQLVALLPRATGTLEIPIAYYAADPAFMRAGAPHAFRVTVDPHGLVAESNEDNNQSTVINIAAPAGCK